jgi:predicted nucleic acid-binding protein
VSRVVFLDTNIVLRLLDPAAPEHPQVRAAIETLEASHDTLVIGLQVLVEMWVVATRPTANNGLGWSPAVARAVLDAMRSRFPLLREDDSTALRWLDLVTGLPVVGKRAHDARIAALMTTNSVQHILTLNVDDFRSMPGIVAIHPATFTAGSP